ncbi:MAG: hypothetical protein ACJARG_001955 [Arcticibacterium sp.]|jgi:hypothetical protein
MQMSDPQLILLEELSDAKSIGIGKMLFDNECCVLKKCCKAYKKKGKHCRKCPKI